MHFSNVDTISKSLFSMRFYYQFTKRSNYVKCDWLCNIDFLIDFLAHKKIVWVRVAMTGRKGGIFRLIKRLKLNMRASISHSAISSVSVLTLSWRFDFGAMKRDWLLILALKTTEGLLDYHLKIRTKFSLTLKLKYILTFAWSCTDLNLFLSSKSDMLEILFSIFCNWKKRRRKP
jgi:hypothetical protein